MVSAAPLIKYLLWDNGIEQSSGGGEVKDRKRHQPVV